MMENYTNFPKTVGKETAVNTLDALLKGNGIGHAYILSGPRGVGKHFLAKRLAQNLLCQSENAPCFTCPACRMIEVGEHPDVTYWHREKDKAQFGVEIIRALKGDMMTYPNEGDLKIYILEEAERMNVSAQNAFLKSLEEPPEYVMFLLLCEDTRRLLTTIRSRAVEIPVATLSDEEMKQWAEGDAKANAFLRSHPKDVDNFIKLSGGCPGIFLELTGEKTGQATLELLDCTKTLLSLLSRRGERLLPFLSSFPVDSKKREQFIARFRMFQLGLRDLLVCKKDEDAPMVLFADREELLNYCDGVPLSRIMQCLRAVEDTLAMADRGNLRLLLTAFAEKSGLYDL